MTTTAVSAPLGSILTAIIDHRGRTPKKLGGDFALAGVRVISAKNVKDGALILDDIRYVTRDMHHQWMPEKLRPGDVLLTSEAPLGEVAYLRDDADFCLGQRLFGLRTDGTKADGRFLYYFFRTTIAQQRLHARATGTTAEGIRQSELLKVIVDLPPLSQQKHISTVLGSLDDKIEVNRRMNETLETMGRTLFRSWFVNFDPVRAKADSLTPQGMKASTADLFPATFQDSSLGKVPVGWKVEALGDCMELKRGYDLPTQQREPGAVPIVSSSGPSGFHAKAMVRGPGIVTGRYGTIGQVFYVDEDFWPLNTTLYVRDCKGHQPRFLYYLLQDVPFEDYSDKAAVPGINRNHLHMAKVIVPPPKIEQRFVEAIEPLWQRHANNVRESLILSELRDVLLPRLLSGEVRVKEAEQVAEVSS